MADTSFQPGMIGPGAGDGAPGWRKPAWFPIRKVWAGGLANVLAWTILAILKSRYGFDPQPVVDSAFHLLDIFTGTPTPAPSAQWLIASAIGGAVAYLVPPALLDRVLWVNNLAVRIANADQSNPTNAKIVSKEEGQQVAAADIAAGLIPPSVVTVISPEK